MDAGYIFYSAYLNRVERTSGIILRPGVRLYADKINECVYRSAFYLGVGLHYKEEYLHGVPGSQFDRGFGLFRAGTLTQHKSTMVTPAFSAGIRLVYTIR